MQNPEGEVTEWPFGPIQTSVHVRIIPEIVAEMRYKIESPYLQSGVGVRMGGVDSMGCSLMLILTLPDGFKV
jgi:hypothetical protein